MGPRSWIATVLHGLSGALTALLLVAIPIAAEADTRWGGVAVIVGLAVAAFGTEVLARRVALLGHGSVLIVAVGGITRVAGPLRHHVALAGDTFVAFVGTHHVVVRQGERGVKLNMRAWGTGENLPRRLHRALRLAGVSGNLDALRHQPRVHDAYPGHTGGGDG